MLRRHFVFGVIFWGGLVSFVLGSQLDLVDTGAEKTATIQRIESELVTFC